MDISRITHDPAVMGGKPYYALGRKSAQITDAYRELNQTLDTVYLGYGLACQELRTAENVVRRLDAGLRRALASRWP